jgi:hypothetical protein
MFGFESIFYGLTLTILERVSRSALMKYIIKALIYISTTNIQGVPGGMDKTSGECSLC